MTKVVSEEPALGGKWVYTKYYYQNKDGNEFIYKEGVFHIGHSTSTDVTLIRPDGEWILFLGVAVRSPTGMTQILRAKRNILYPLKLTNGRVEERLENGESCTRVEFDLSEEEKETLSRSVLDDDPAMNFGTSAAAIKAREQARLVMPSRCEYFISKNTGYIILERTYSENGKKLSEAKVISIDKNSSLPISNFEIPRSDKILLPENANEYFSVTRKYRSQQQQQQQ